MHSLTVVLTAEIASKAMKTLPTDDVLGGYEGKYPKDLFKKSVVANGEPIGYVAKETDDVIVVFSDAGNERFDIPKSIIGFAGGSVIINEPLAQYLVDKDSPLPQGKSLRASTEQIRQSARRHFEEEEKRLTTADAIMRERRELAASPRPATFRASRLVGYVETESKTVKKMKRAARELKELIVAGTKVAKKEAVRARRKAEAKHASMDAHTISRMGGLAMMWADSFEDVLSEIRTRTYADQVDIYTGFMKLMDQQRNLVLARRDLALRLRDSVKVPVVKVVQRRSLRAPPQLPSLKNEEPTARSSRRRSVKRGEVA